MGMPTGSIESIINARMPAGDKTSEALCKLILIAIHQRRAIGLTVAEFADLLQCGERTMYRNLKVLKDTGWITDQWELQ